MCDCKKDIEAKLLERFIKQTPEAKDHGATLAGYTLVLTEEKIIQKGCMPIELIALYPPKKGGYKGKRTSSNMIYTFCPFCGEKYEKGGAA